MSQVRPVQHGALALQGTPTPVPTHRAWQEQPVTPAAHVTVFPVLSVPSQTRSPQHWPGVHV